MREVVRSAGFSAGHGGVEDWMLLRGSFGRGRLCRRPNRCPHVHHRPAREVKDRPVDLA